MTVAPAAARRHPESSGALSRGEVLVSLLYAVLGGLATVVDVLAVQPEQKFTSLMSGGLALSGDRKGGDIVALPAGVIVGVVIGVAIAQTLRAQPDTRRRTELTAHLLWWYLPGAMALGALELGVPLPVDLTVVSLLAGGLAWSETLLSRRSGRMLEPSAVSLSVLGCFLWAVAPLTLVLAASRTTLGIATIVERVPWVVLAAVAFLAACALELSGARRGREGMHAKSRRFVALPGCLLPLLLLTLYPARLVLPDGTTDSYDTSPVFLAVCWVLALVGVALTLRQGRPSAPRESATSGDRALPPVAVLSLLLGTMFGATRAPELTRDDYHFGEALLGWFRYQSGDLPYVDHQPAHGLVQDDLAALLTSAFFDGSAAAHTETTRLVCAMLAALVFASVVWATRSQMLAVVVVLVAVAPIASPEFPMNGMTWALLVAVGWFLIAPRLRDRPQWWLVSYIVVGPVLLLAAPAQGLVLVIAATALAATSVVRVCVAKDPRQAGPPAVAAVVVTVIAVATPLGAMAVEAVRYVVSNAVGNEAAYGLPWDPSFAGGDGTAFPLEVLRMLWVIGLVLCTVVALGELRARQLFSERLTRAVFLGAFLGGVLPYVMGRVDAGIVSRAGLATAFVLALVVPALGWHELRPTGRAMASLGMVAAMAALFGATAQPRDLVTAARPFASSPDLIDGSAVGLPGWGRAAPGDTDALDQTVRLARILDQDLQPGEPYYDATSRNAQYFYLQRRPVVAVTAAYNTPLPSAQSRTIRELKQAAPRVAVLHQPLGNTEHDGGGLALRTPLLARFLEQAYTPYQEDGFILGHRGRDAPAGAETAVTLVIDSLTDDNWDRGESRVSPTIKLVDAAAALFVQEGASVLIPDGSTRRVVSVQPGGSLELSSPLADGLVGASVRSVTISTSDVDLSLYRTWLFEQSFGNGDLGRQASSWGASLGSIEGLSEVSDVDGSGLIAVDTPMLRMEMPDGIDETDVDLVSFDVTCEDEVESPEPARVRVGWETARTFGDAPGRTFDVATGSQLVPLDSSAYWRAGFGAEALTFTVVSAGGCDSGVTVSDVALWKR